MSSAREIFQQMPERFVPRPGSPPKTFYFSVGPEKWTVTIGPDQCEVREGKHTDNADCVLKCDPDLFANLVLHGKMPGAIDIARGKIKTNDPNQLRTLMERFRFDR
jgi:putative sterol carrier protein